MLESSKLPFAVNLAVVIGINNYQNGFNPLETARFDAERFAKILQESYHYDVTLLKDEQATSENIRNHLQLELLKKIKSYQDKRQKVRLLFYFAGHGTPPQEEDKGGALVPQDAETINKEKWLLMDEVKTALTNLNCDHLLIILDCCFAGSFRTSTRKFVFKKTEELSKERYYNYIKFPAAQVMASAAHDQTAADTYSFKDNRGKIENSGHSPFAYFLFKALEEQAADYTKDGITTATELNLYLFEELQQQKQICRTWNLPTHDKGEFFFQTGDFDPNNLPDAVTLNQENNPYRGLESFNEAHSRFFFGRNEAIENLTNKIAAQPLTIVLGSSGSGKSSLVKAGLIPNLREKQPQWRIFEPIRLSSTPFSALAKALLPLILKCSHLNLDVIDQLYELEKILRKKRREDSNNPELKRLLAQWRRTAPEEQLLLIIQDFEQLKEICVENSGQQKALENLRQMGLTNSRIVLDNLDKLKRYCNPQEKEQLESFHQKCQDKIARCSQDWSNKGESFGIFLKDLLSKYANNQKILLVIDQFEELITQSSEKKREEFLNALQSALKACPEQLRLVVTLRDDFKHDFENKPQLKDHWTNACFTIPQMGRNQLREVIEEPASVQVLYFEEKAGKSLSEQLLDDIGDTSGVLPLLSFTLSELYYKYVQKERQDRTLRWEDYDELGGVTQALTNKATEEYENLKYNLEQGGEKSQIEPLEAQARQTLLRWVMLRMINLDGGVRTKRAVLEDELQYSEEETNKRRELVINRFVDARLFLTGTNLERKTYFEPAHDILIREWDKIKIWLGETAETVNETQGQASPKSSWFGLILGNNRSKKESTLFDLNLQRQLTSAATEWDKNTRQGESDKKLSKKVGGWLWNGNARLPLAREVLLSPTDNWLNQVETEFVKGSIGKERQNRNRLIGGVSTFIVVLIAGLGFSLLGQADARKGQITASQQASEANLQSGQELEALTTSLRAGKLLKDWPWYLALFKPDSKLQAQVTATLRTAVYTTTEINQWQGVEGYESSTKMAFNSQGELILAKRNDDSNITLKNLFKNISVLLGGHEGSVECGIAFSNDARLVATADSKGNIRLWNLDGKKIMEFSTQVSKKDDNPDRFCPTLLFSPDSKQLAIVEVYYGGTLKARSIKNINLWDLSGDNPRRKQPFQNFEFYEGVGFDSNNQLVVAHNSDNDSSLSLSEFLSGKELAVFQGEFQNFDATNLIFSPDGNRLIMFNYLVDLKNPDWNENNMIPAVNFSPDGQKIVQGNEVVRENKDGTRSIADQSGTISIANLDGTPLLKLKGNKGEVIQIVVSSNGKQLASTGSDGTLHLWDLREKQLIKVLNSLSQPEQVKFEQNSKNENIEVMWQNDQYHFGAIYVRDKSSGKLLFKTESEERSSDLLNLSPDGTFLAGLSEDSVTLWDSTGRKMLNSKAYNKVSFNDNKIPQVKVSDDNSVLALEECNSKKDIATISTDSCTPLMSVQIEKFDELLSTSCDRIRDYLQNNPNVSKEDKKLCDGISEAEKLGEISMGDKILVATLMNPDKLAGVEAISNGDFQEAIQRLEAYLENTPNDPEALIYLNNARIGNQTSYTIAISAPIGSDVNGTLEMLRGVAQAQDEINKQRGINGIPLRVLIADDDNKPNTAKQIAEQLVKNPDVLGVIGHYASDVTLAAGKVYEAGKLVAISPVSTSVKLTGFGKYIFRTVPSDSIAAKALADDMLLRLEKKNAAVFYNSQSGYSESLKSEFIKFLRKEGGQVSKKLIFDLSDPNFKADESVEQSIESGAEVLVLLPNTGELDHTLQVLKANNKRLPLLGGDDVYTPKVLKEGAEDSVGMVVAIPWHISASQTNFPNTSRQLWRADVNWRTAMSYDATIALIEGLKNNPSREGLAQTLHLQDFTAKSAATGGVKFKSGDRDREIQLVEIQANPQSRSKTGYDFEPVREYSRE